MEKENLHIIRGLFPIVEGVYSDRDIDILKDPETYLRENDPFSYLTYNNIRIARGDLTLEIITDGTDNRYICTKDNFGPTNLFHHARKTNIDENQARLLAKMIVLGYAAKEDMLDEGMHPEISWANTIGLVRSIKKTIYSRQDIIFRPEYEAKIETTYKRDHEISGRVAGIFLGDVEYARPKYFIDVEDSFGIMRLNTYTGCCITPFKDGHTQSMQIDILSKKDMAEYLSDLEIGLCRTPIF